MKQSENTPHENEVAQNAASTRGVKKVSHRENEKRGNDFSRGAQLSRFSYNALMTAALPALGVYSLWRRLGQKRSRESLHGMWGGIPDEALLALSAASTRTEAKRENTKPRRLNAEITNAKHAGAKSTNAKREPAAREDANSANAGRESEALRIWIHAVSVGECAAARVVARALREELPNARLALSTTTDTGQETARAALAAGEVDATFYFPLDALFPVRRALHSVKPDAFLCLETELWPNFLHEARRAGAKTFLVNGRVSDNLLRRAPQMGRVWRWTLSGLDAILMRSQFDAARMRKLGAPLSRLVVTGDVKLDALPQEEENVRARDKWQRVLASENAPLFVAGSTHPGEEETVLSAWKTLRREFPTLRLLIAPRHIERTAQVLELTRRTEPTAIARSQIAPCNEAASSADAPPIADALHVPPVVVLDTIGELAESYAAADVAFVGGSLIERGGHNLLEPVMRGAPVAFGPHVMNFRDAARWVEAENIGAQVEDENALVQILGNWLRDDNTRRESAKSARKKLRENIGAARRVAEIVARELDRKTGAEN